MLCPKQFLGMFLVRSTPELDLGISVNTAKLRASWTIVLHLSILARVRSAIIRVLRRFKENELRDSYSWTQNNWHFTIVHQFQSNASFEAGCHTTCSRNHKPQSSPRRPPFDHRREVFGHRNVFQRCPQYQLTRVNYKWLFRLDTHLLLSPIQRLAKLFGIARVYVGND